MFSIRLSPMSRAILASIPFATVNLARLCWVGSVHSLPYASGGEELFEARIWNEIIMERNNSTANIYFNQQLDAEVIDQNPYNAYRLLPIECHFPTEGWKWIYVATLAYGLEYSSNLRIMKIKVHRMPAFPLNMEDWWFPISQSRST